MSLLTVAGICKTNERGFALQDINFIQQRFQKIVVAGETGSGKSTLLKIIAGLVQPDSGTVLFDGVRVKGPDEQLLPGHPRIAYLSQHYELRNHYRVEELLEMANQLTDEGAATIYELCRISHLLNRRTDQLSGGERQRIALARLLAASPAILVLDEPFSNLDPTHKAILKTVIAETAGALGITCLLASHDPQDTLSWADRILVLKDGRLMQQGSPEQLYRQPVNQYVAGLFGKYNLIPAGSIAEFCAFPALIPEGGQLLVRPEGFKIEAEKSHSTVEGTVISASFWGSYHELEIALPEIVVTVQTPVGQFVPGDTIFLSLRPGSACYI